VYEKEKRIGGLLRYGIPNFKLDKKEVVQRRVDLMEKEGIQFITEANVGVNLPIKKLEDEYDAIILSIGAGKPRDLEIPNRDSKGIYFAMDFLSQNNSRLEGEFIDEVAVITAKNKRVLVIGGGDTGSDCVGTSIRQGAEEVMQIELLSKSPLERTADMPWPTYPRLFKLSTSQEEGCKLEFDVLSKSFIKGKDGEVVGVNCVKIVWNGRSFSEIEGSEFIIETDLVLLAMGFLGPIQESAIREFAIEVDERSNIKASNYKTNLPKIFSCGDARRGQSLVVWAILEGRECAIAVDEYLMDKKSMLNRKDKSLCEL
jgi:glutamate synthase (NADPH/NADH) small chain